MPTTYANTTATNSVTSNESPPATMDREFIGRNQIVERYLAGSLPPKGASEFERFVRAHPAVLDELGFADRVHSGLRLLEVSGTPEPWAEKPTRFWQQLPFIAGMAAVCASLLVVAVLLGGKVSDQSGLIAKLKQEVIERPIAPTSSSRRLIVQPSLVSAASATSVALAAGQMTELKIEVTQTNYSTFRVVIDRENHGRVAILDNMLKDSNGHVRLQLNPAAFGAGDYLLTLEGLNMRREGTPAAWVRLNVGR